MNIAFLDWLNTRQLVLMSQFGIEGDLALDIAINEASMFIEMLHRLDGEDDINDCIEVEFEVIID